VYVNGTVHTHGIENFWSLLKRTIKGTYVSAEPSISHGISNSRSSSMRRTMMPVVSKPRYHPFSTRGSHIRTDWERQKSGRSESHGKGAVGAERAADWESG
jgi:hypothetical protein